MTFFKNLKAWLKGNNPWLVLLLGVGIGLVLGVVIGGIIGLIVGIIIGFVLRGG